MSGIGSTSPLSKWPASGRNRQRRRNGTRTAPRCLRQTADAVVHACRRSAPRREKAMGSSQCAIATTEVESGGLLKPRNALKLVVLGATGGTGLEIVRQVLGCGHSVTAFVRSPERLSPFQDRISGKQGNLLDTAQLEQVLKGHDVVLSGFGPRAPASKADAHLLEQFAIALTSAM